MRRFLIPILVAVLCMLSGAFIVLSVEHAFSQSIPDTDGDGWTDGYEIHIGTSPASKCIPYQNYDGVDTWPPDFNRDNYVDISDIVVVARRFGIDTNNTPYYYRFDVSPEPMGDGVVDIGDVVAVGELF